MSIVTFGKDQDVLELSDQIIGGIPCNVMVNLMDIVFNEFEFQPRY